MWLNSRPNQGPYCYFRLSVVAAIIKDTFFLLASIESLEHVTGILITLVDIKRRKISHVSKNPYVFDVMPNNFRCIDRRRDCCVLYPVHIQQKVKESKEKYCWRNTEKCVMGSSRSLNYCA